MKFRNGEECGLILKKEVEYMMYCIVVGVEWLYNHGIIHKDLKVLNVIVKEVKNHYSNWNCCGANYECSMGLVGMRFFWTSEIITSMQEVEVESETTCVFKESRRLQL